LIYHTHQWIYNINIHTGNWYQIRMKILIQESFPPLAKEVRGFEIIGKKQILLNLLLSKKKGIKEIEFMRLPCHFVPRNDDSEFLLP